MYKECVPVLKKDSFTSFVHEQISSNPWGIIYKIYCNRLKTETILDSISTRDSNHVFTRRDTAATLLYGLLVKILLDQTDFFSCMAKRSEQEFTEIFVTLFQAHCLEYTMQV